MFMYGPRVICVISGDCFESITNQNTIIDGFYSNVVSKVKTGAVGAKRDTDTMGDRCTEILSFAYIQAIKDSENKENIRTN